MALGAYLQPYLFPDLSNTPSISDFVLSIYIGVVLLAIRLACEAISTPLLRNALVKKQKKPSKIVGKVISSHLVGRSARSCTRLLAGAHLFPSVA
jgi:hypothetical protein